MSTRPSFLDVTEIAQEAEEIRGLIDQIDTSLYEDVTGGGAFLLNLVLLRQLLQQAGGEGALEGPALVGDQPAGEEGVDPVVQLLQGDLLRFELEKQVSNGEDIFDNAISPSRDGATLRITVAFDTAMTLSANISRGNNESGDNLFNEGNNLGANQIFAFDLPGVPADAEVNYVSGADGLANSIAVLEVDAKT